MTDITDKYKIKKTLGQGYFGVTYDVVGPDGINYAMKLLKITPQDVKEENCSCNQVWKEINNLRWIIRLPPKDRQFFLQLHEGGVSTKKFKLKRPTGAPKEDWKRIKAANASPLSLCLVCNKLDGVLDSLIGRLTLPQKKSMLCQVIGALSILRKSGFCHSDAHLANIMYLKVPRNKIVSVPVGARRIKVKTHGYLFNLIDYGFMEKCSTQRRYKFNYDLSYFICQLCRTSWNADIGKRVNWLVENDWKNTCDKLHEVYGKDANNFIKMVEADINLTDLIWVSEHFFADFCSDLYVLAHYKTIKPYIPKNMLEYFIMHRLDNDACIKYLSS